MQKEREERDEGQEESSVIREWESITGNERRMKSEINKREKMKTDQDGTRRDRRVK